MSGRKRPGRCKLSLSATNWRIQETLQALHRASRPGSLVTWPSHQSTADKTGQPAVKGVGAGYRRARMGRVEGKLHKNESSLKTGP